MPLFMIPISIDDTSARATLTDGATTVEINYEFAS
jgi:hypothetical protein